MKKRFLRIISLALALVLVCSVMPVMQVSAAENVVSGTCGDNLTWGLDDTGTLTISGTGDMNDFPGDAPWYSHRDKIVRVVIKSGVTSIGDFAFSDCSNLTGITIPKGVTYLGEQAFSGCSSLTGVTMPEGIGYIPKYAFSECTSLTSITIPESVAYIGFHAFYNCSSLTEITISQSIANIYGPIFDGCSALTDVYYGGTAEQWAAMEVEVLTTAYIHYSCTESAGHWKTNTKAATCTAPAYTFDSCACGYQKDMVSSGNALGHTWDKGVVTKAPTKDQEGIRTYTCGSCDATKTERIPKLLSAPAKPYKIANVVSGVHVYWKNTEGAVKYGLWRSETGKDGTYKWVANPTVPHFTDTKVETGKTYFYKVTSMDANGNHSEKSEAIGVTYVGTPDITSRTNTAAGVKLGWEKITGATGYAIYRKSYDGNDAWVRIGTISGNATFTWTDTSVKNNNGEIYRYTIRALAGADMKTLSGCRNTGRTMVRLSSQVLKSAEKASATSIKCTWTTSSRVTGYEVRFTAADGTVKTFTVGNYKTGTKTFTGLKAGQTYTVQVRTYKKVDGVGSFYSDWSAAKTVKI